MINETSSTDPRDARLWQLARRRASFRRGLASYLIINAFLWAIWFLTGRNNYGGGVPWPVWPTLGWGIGIAFSWWSAFGPGQDDTEKEYERLKRDRN